VQGESARLPGRARALLAARPGERLHVIPFD
jgi:hypothetical protein